MMCACDLSTWKAEVAAFKANVGYTSGTCLKIQTNNQTSTLTPVGLEYSHDKYYWTWENTCQLLDLSFLHV